MPQVIGSAGRREIEHCSGPGDSNEKRQTGIGQIKAGLLLGQRLRVIVANLQTRRPGCVRTGIVACDDACMAGGNPGCGLCGRGLRYRRAMAVGSAGLQQTRIGDP